MYQCFCVEKHGEFIQCINYFILRFTYLFCHSLHVFMCHYPSIILKTRGGVRCQRSCWSGVFNRVNDGLIAMNFFLNFFFLILGINVEYLKIQLYSSIYIFFSFDLYFFDFFFILMLLDVFFLNSSLII
jgi:hypothetical protein